MGNHIVIERSGLEPGELMAVEKDREFFHAPHNYCSYLLAQFLKKHYDDKNSVMCHCAESMWVRKDNFCAAVKMLQDVHGFYYTMNNSQLILRNDENFIIMDLNRAQEIEHVKIYSIDAEFAKTILNDIKKFDAKIKKLSFYWIVNAKGDAFDIVEEWDESVSADLYPFIDDFDTYAERFIESKSNILILIGPPGTGKTTFIKHLLSAMDKKAFLTYDEEVLSGDGSFAEFISDSEAGAFVIEDADLFLRSRAEGNGMVSRFLNIGDGLIKMKNKKLIFSTNLPSIKDVDAALIRPGRCFDILEFRPLTPEEANVVASNINRELVPSKKSYTLAEIFNAPINEMKPRNIGFV